MDTDTLISSVYVRTSIWDKRDKLHANRPVICKLWKEIAEEMQHEETVLRKRWKYLREKFSSEYKKRRVRRSGGAAHICPPSKWPYFRQLMFLKDIVQTKASSGSISSFLGAPSIMLPVDTGPAEVDIDDAVSQCSHDSHLASASDQVQEAMDDPQEMQKNVKDSPLFSQVAGPSFEAPVSSTGKRRSQEEDYVHYKKMCTIEKKLEILFDREARKKSEADREDEDLMFLKTLLPHMRKIPQRLKLRFQSRIQSVVEEFAYGPQPATTV